MMKYFFWIAFAVFLAASIPHVAYFFASFEPSDGPEGIWWWAVSYAIAISIDVTVYLLSYTAFQRYRKYHSARAVWRHWLLIIICTLFSWAVNWAYAKQFHSPTMLSAAETTAPWLINVFPFMASAFPLLGIVYTMMAETITDDLSDDGQEDSMLALQQEKKSALSIASVRRVLTTGNLESKRITTVEETPILPEEETPQPAKNEESKTITGQFVTVNERTEEHIHEKHTGALDNSPDKLQMTIEALKIRPGMNDKELAEYLSLKRPASARFWRVKATEIINSAESEPEAEPVPVRRNWTTTDALTTGSDTQRQLDV